MNKLIKTLVALVFLMIVKQDLNAQTLYDFGDVPASYEQNTKNQYLPARHRINNSLTLGDLVDAEAAPQSVMPGADNNGVNGDGLDEDGITGLPPLLFSGSEYRVSVSVTNNFTTATTVHAWIDMNGDGRFSADEYTSVPVRANSGKQTVELVWPVVINGPGGKHLYMRIRVSQGPLTDYIYSYDVDERSIGDGLSTGLNAATPSFGEVEDYQISVDERAATLQDCGPSDSRLGMSPPIKALFHGSILRTADGGFLVFGSGANPKGGTQFTPLKVENGVNGFVFDGVPLIMTGLSHKYFMLTSAGLYSWGASDFGTPFMNPRADIHPEPLPPEISPAYVQHIDAGLSTKSNALVVLTKTGDVWVYSSAEKSHVNGNGNLPGMQWHKVMLNATTPLTGIVDVRTSGNAVIATDGNNFYTWGGNVMTGDGTGGGTTAPTIVNRPYATKMIPPVGISLPVKQMEISQKNDLVASYYLRDAAGKVFVLGGNARGQLGLGNLNAVTRWSVITQMNEQPDGPNLDTDVTKPISKVRWISASNSDGEYPQFSLITEEGRNYTVASNDHGYQGSMGGAPKATNIYLPTAITTNGGKQMMPGKVLFVGAGGHISIITIEGQDNYGYVGHTILGSDGCAGCTMSPAEFDFRGPPSVGELCGTSGSCYIPGATNGQSLQSFVGITSLGRAGTIDADKWPKVRSGAWLVLESKTKGFVPNRVAFNASGLPVGIPTGNFVEGMLVYDTTNNCLKMYTSKDKGGSYGWYKIESQACPD
ncbi:GEVED domain-containing protein [Sphingobacterium sp. MYb382]|uniref:GEVED domain-containing protein n=1 Tax=Sphingobacterium sp. MYb382 TaxID=2745278 RepID=UPI0030B7C210